MSVRTISDDEMREIFSIVDKDSGGTVSARMDIYIRGMVPSLPWKKNTSLLF